MAALEKTEKLKSLFLRLRKELGDLDYARYHRTYYQGPLVRSLELLIASILDGPYHLSDSVQTGLFQLWRTTEEAWDLLNKDWTGNNAGFVSEFDDLVNEIVKQGGEVLNQMEEELKNKKDQKKGARC